MQGDLRLLKVVVKVMGIVLFFGTIALFVAVYYKFVMKAPKEISLESTNNLAKSCAYIKSKDIKLTGKVTSANVNGGMLTLVTSDTAKSLQQIILFDLCAGKELSRVNVLSD